MSATGFSTTWLSDRFSVDARSRDKHLKEQFIQKLPKKETLLLADLGAGIGNNVLYFLHEIKANIHWYLIEVDEALVRQGMHYLDQELSKRGYTVKPNSHGLLAQNEFNLSIHFVSSSIFEVKKTQWLAFDGLVGNALLDVFNREQIDLLIENLYINPAPKLFTLIYQDMTWGDPDPDNDLWVHKYHEHMQRNQNGHHGLGPEAAHYVEIKLRELAIPFTQATSIWELGRQDQKILNHLIQFYDRSIPELPFTDHEGKLFKDWIVRKTALNNKGKLTAEVIHQDFLL